MPDPNNFNYVPLIVPFITFFLGVIATWLYKKWDNRQTLLKKRVFINQMGFSAQHQDWGSLELYYEGRPANNIHYISVEIINDSNRDLKDINFDIAFPLNCIIYKDRAQYWSNGLSLDLFLEKGFYDFFERIRNESNNHIGTYPNTPYPSNLQNAINQVTRQRKYSVPVLNRDSKLVIEIMAEFTTNLISEEDVYMEFFSTGIKVIPYIEDAKREKLKKSWIEYGGLFIYILFSYPVYLLTHNPGLIVLFMIINLFFAGIIALQLYNLFQWLKKIVKY